MASRESFPALTPARASVGAPSSASSAGRRLKNFGKPPRVMGLDIARALAIIGMMAAHTLAPEPVFVLFDPATWKALAQGFPSLLFALLAGISITLLTAKGALPTREQMPRIRLQLLGRALVIFAVGLVLEQLGTSIAIILCLYAVLYVIALPLVRLGTVYLYAVAALSMLLGPALFVGLRTLSLEQEGAGWALIYQSVYSLPAWVSLMALGMALGRLNLLEIKTAAALVGTGVLLLAAGIGLGNLVGANLPFSVHEPAIEQTSPGAVPSPEQWQAKLEKMQAAQHDAAMVPGSKACPGSAAESKACAPMLEKDAPAFAGGAKSSTEYSDEPMIMSTWQDYPHNLAEAGLEHKMLAAFTGAEAHSGGSIEILLATGVGMIVIGLSLIVAHLIRLPLIPLAAMGAMPLTIYSAHVIAIWVASGPRGIIVSDSFFWWLVLGSAVFASLWFMFFKRGPLEALANWGSQKMAD